MPVPTSGTATMTTPTDEQILITREFDAPKHLVWRAWTTPELVTRWWSGRRGEMTHVEIDLRVGGTWRYVMLAHGEFEIAFHGTYREVVPEERIVTTEVFEGMPGPSEDAVINIVTFAEEDGRTRLELLVQAVSKEIRDAIIDSGMEGGMQDQMDALEGWRSRSPSGLAEGAPHRAGLRLAPDRVADVDDGHRALRDRPAAEGDARPLAAQRHRAPAPVAVDVGRGAAAGVPETAQRDRARGHAAHRAAARARRARAADRRGAGGRRRARSCPVEVIGAELGARS